MVYFKGELGALKRPDAPPVCPKCGSHRTEVIGKADGTNQPVVRCNVCGAISNTGAANAK